MWSYIFGSTVEPNTPNTPTYDTINARLTAIREQMDKLQMERDSLIRQLSELKPVSPAASTAPVVAVSPIEELQRKMTSGDFRTVLMENREARQFRISLLPPPVAVKSGLAQVLDELKNKVQPI